MIRALNNPGLSKDRPLIIVEYILLGLCLCVIALRATFTESPTAQSPTLPGNVGDTLYSLTISGALIIGVVLWLVVSSFSKRFLYRVTGIEIGLCIFFTAAIIAGFAATDKRLAITDVTMLLAPVLCAILLIQILDSPSKVRLVLAVIAALGVVCAYQSVWQWQIDNPVMIEEYENAPQNMLEPLGIQPDSFQQFLFEHRLYTGGVRGFFTTRNSAGAFGLIASFAAFALFIDKLKDRHFDPSRPLHLFARGAALAFILFGLALTRSKGAIIGLLFATALLVAHLYFGNWLKNHRRFILIACLLLAIAGTWAIASYGLTHGRLPGGNPMLVRWQYWHASARMYADHPLTGVGPGNFAQFYPHYKPAAALESVADPHNFVLSILTQYGPLGLAGFLAMIFFPLWKVASAEPTDASPTAKWREPVFRTLATAYLIIVCAAMLLTRPMITAQLPSDTLEVIIYVIMTLYAAPVAVFVIGFLLLTTPLRGAHNAQHAMQNTKIAAILFCAILGVTLHNLIDFAIFEPGVFTAFWAIIACLIATDFHRGSRSPTAVKVSRPTRLVLSAAGLILMAAYVLFVWSPVYKSTVKIRQAHQAIAVSRFRQAHALLSAAAEDDRLSPAALSLNGRLYLQQYDQIGQDKTDLLEKAADCFHRAVGRNPADYKNYEKLSTVYDLLGQPQEAYDWCARAVELYPGSGRLHFKLAQIAEELHKNGVAVEHYRRAIEIEDDYRRQFQRVYPERKKIVSRIGQEKYDYAVERIKELSKKSNI
jgi:O-antigen ligase